MHRLGKTLDIGLWALAMIVLLSLVSASPVRAQADWQRDLVDWRTQHAAELQQPDSWLALVGLEWLEAGDNSFGSAPDNKIHLPAAAPAHLGILHLEGATITLKPSPLDPAPAPGRFPAGFLVAGQPAAAQALRVDIDSDKNNPRLTIGSLMMYVIKRGDRFALRIKDSHSAALTGFHGLNWYPADAKYRVTARWIPYIPPRTTTLATLIGTHYSQPVPGVAEFTLDGKTYRLEPVIEDPAEGKLFFILRDTTSKTTTYAACRFLYTAYPDHGLKQPGRLVLDFNRIENPPCAYTTFATCPLPPAGNRLLIAIPAGEKRYHD